MLQIIETINTAVNNFIWGVPAMVCIFGVGLYLSIRTNFLQIRKFPYAIKTTLGRIFRKRDASDGAITPFQAVCTALAATVGTGNIAGVAGAIAIGGPGAIFWMWVSALFGMCTKYAEVTLAVHYREINANGELVGGPMYYIKNGLSKKWHWLAYLFAAFGVLTVFGTGNATQVNTITTAINSALLNYNVISESAVSTSNLIIGIIIAILIAMILLGGIKRIGHVTEKLVPFMALLYILLGLGVILLNIQNVPAVFASIFRGAFQPRAVTGGIVLSMFTSLKKGVSRGIFSNEAGLGTGSIAHACADTKKPVKQGFFGIFEVFVDTFVVCTITALTVLVSGEWTSGATNATLALNVFTHNFGVFGTVVLTLIMVVFSVTTSGGWYAYYEVVLRHLAKNHPKVKKYLLLMFKYFYAVPPFFLTLYLIYVGDLSIWTLVDITSGIPTFVNVAVILILSGQYFKLLKDYKARYMHIGQVDPDMAIFYEDKPEVKAALEKEKAAQK